MTRGLFQRVWTLFAAAAAPEPRTELVVAPAPPGEVVRHVVIKDLPGDAPRFQRQYQMVLDHRCRITVRMTNRHYGGGRDGVGELEQPDRSAVYFDPDRIADRILDPALVPLVRQAVKQIYALDADYMRTRPSEWTDDRGTKWKRA